MEGAVERLQHVGLAEYEAKVYLALLNAHLSTATQASEKSEVPPTKIYSVPESLFSDQNPGQKSIVNHLRFSNLSFLLTFSIWLESVWIVQQFAF